MAVIAETLIDVARCIVGSLHPLTGTRARVRARVFAKKSDQALLPGTFLIPVVDGSLRHELLYRVAKHSTAKNGKWEGATVVELHSNLGGLRQNMVTVGSKLRFDPALEGFEPDARVIEVLEPATDPVEGQLAIWGAVAADSAPGALVTVDLWRSYLGGKFPAVLVSWESSEPAAGLATSSLGRGGSRVGEGEQLYAENWWLYILSSREDSEAMRRSDGLRLMQAVSALLTDRQTLEGLVFSYPSGVQIRARQRVPFGAKELQQQMQVYGIRLASTGGMTRADTRTYADLRRFELNAPKHTDTGQVPVVVDNLIDNTAPYPYSD